MQNYKIIFILYQFAYKICYFLLFYILSDVVCYFSFTTSGNSTEHHIQDTVQPLREYPEEQGNNDEPYPCTNIGELLGGFPACYHLE